MKISAMVKNTSENHQVIVATNENQIAMKIKPKVNGRGSSINGGELLFLALATCYCNDIFREAESMDISVDEIVVHVEGEFGGRGDPAKNVIFDVRISADATNEKIQELLEITDSVAEIHNSLRNAIPITLRRYKIL